MLPHAPALPPPVLLVAADGEDRALLRERLACGAALVEASSLEAALSAARRGAWGAFVLAAPGGSDDVLQGAVRLAEAGRAPVILVLQRDAAAVAARASALGVDEVVERDALPAAQVPLLLALTAARFQARQAAARARTLAARIGACAAGLAVASTPDEATEAILDGAALLGVIAAAVLRREGDDLLLAASRGLSPEVSDRLAAVAISTPGDLDAEAARRGEPVWEGARGALPLCAEPGVVGVLDLAFPADGAPDDDTRAALAALAPTCARALARAWKLAREESADHRLLAMVVHDMRSPLQVIGLSASLLASKSVAPECAARVARRIGAAAAHAGAMVGDLLDMSAVRLGAFRVRPAEGDLFPRLALCLEDFRVRAPGREITLTCKGDGRATIDADRVAQAVGNLLANALAHGDARSPITVRAEGSADRLYVEVGNRGPLIPAPRLAAIFDPLTRATADGEKGSIGLGLFIARSIAEAHGGRAWARSEAETGTAFVLELPRTPGPVRARPRPLPLADGPAGDLELPPHLARLLPRLGEGPLRTALLHWLSMGGSVRLPHPRHIDDPRMLPVLPDTAVVGVEAGGAPGQAIFRLLDVGGALERRLGRGLAGEVVPPGGAGLGVDMHAAYQRCLSARAPVYDYLRFGPGAGAPLFDRLVLPFAHEGRAVTHLAAVARFTHFPEAP